MKNKKEAKTKKIQKKLAIVDSNLKKEKNVPKQNLWENLPTWLKNGIKGVLILPALFIINFLLTLGIPSSQAAAALATPLAPGIYLMFLLGLVSFSNKILLLLLFNIIAYFLVGFLFGWIIAKLRQLIKRFA